MEMRIWSGMPVPETTPADRLPDRVVVQVAQDRRFLELVRPERSCLDVLLVADGLGHFLRDADATGLRQGADPSRDVHPVAVHAALAEDDVPHVDADANGVVPPAPPLACIEAARRLVDVMPQLHLGPGPEKDEPHGVLTGC